MAEKETRLANLFWKTEIKTHNLLKCQTVNVAQYLACSRKKDFLLQTPLFLNKLYRKQKIQQNGFYICSFPSLFVEQLKKRDTCFC